MNKKEFAFIISEGEGFNVEFKESLISNMQKESYEQRFYSKSGQISGQKLTERQKEILKIIKDEPFISREALVEKLNINPLQYKNTLQN